MIRRRITRLGAAGSRLARAAPAPAAGFVSRPVVAAGLRLHVRERVTAESAGPAWLLLHGLAVSHRYLMPTAAALPGDVYVPDLPGFGFSAKPRQVYDPGQHAEVLADLLRVRGISGVNVLGNSFGCQVAVELAVRRPDLVASLVLVGPTADPVAATATGLMLRWLRDLPGEDPRQARILAADFRDAGPRRVLETLRHCARHPMEQRLRLVRAPVLLLRGEHDPIAPARWLDRAGRATRDGRTGEVPFAAHNAVTTAGTRVAAAAAAFADVQALRAS